MTKWRNEAGDELTVPVHQLIDCTTLHDERRQWCIGRAGLAAIFAATLRRPPDFWAVVHPDGWIYPASDAPDGSYADRDQAERAAAGVAGARVEPGWTIAT